jgi:hypothetical protein
MFIDAQTYTTTGKTEYLVIQYFIYLIITTVSTKLKFYNTSLQVNLS